MSRTATARNVELELADEVAKFYADPLGFTRFAYPWGEPGPLANEPGPDENQQEFLTALGAEVKARRFDGSTPVMPILMSETSGHGTGKSAMGGWIANWILSTRPFSVGTVTAGTYQQLETRTWAAIQYWTKLCITSHWFRIQASGIFAKESPDNWKLVMQTCKEENAQAFAGQHARTSTSWYLFDEASEVPDEIWRVARGGLTDGEPMFLAWGQPSRNTGQFYEICFGSQAGRWNHRRVDSRTSRFTNKDLIAQWLEDYGENSDFFRVRVLGLPPTASELQFIDWERVRAAVKRQVSPLDDEPLIAGFDVSGGGAAWNVIRFRRGQDARSIPPVRISGDKGRDRAVLIGVAAEVLRNQYGGRKVAAMFVDSAFGAPIVERLHTLGFNNVHEVSFGGHSADPHQENMRAYMWNRMKDWLLTGGIPDDEDLGAQLTRPGYHINRSNRLVLESKEDMRNRGEASPDDADALCFVAGTRVQTVRGPITIEQIQVGDMVVTPFGPSPVMIRHESDAQTLTDVRFSNGAKLVGKGEHEIFTFSHGKVRMDALSLTDEVEPLSRWRLALWRIVSLCSTEARSFGFKRLVNTFNLGTPVLRRDFSIAASGSITTALYRTAMRFITSMATGAIAPLRTWACAPLVPTRASTCYAAGPTLESGSECFGTSQSQSRRPGNGTVLQPGSLGTKSMGSELGRAGRPSMQSADAVGSCTKRSSQPGLSSAPRPVFSPPCSRATSRISGLACSAARRLQQIVTGRRPVVPISVRTGNVPPTKTYNLTLAEHNAYYANGILVFNCLTFAQPVAPAAPPRPAQPFRPPNPHAWMA